MPKLTPIQESFSAGELSPRMISRISAKGYREGALRMENMISLPQGPGKRRPGIRFGFEVPVPAAQARILPFPISTGKFYSLLFIEGALYYLNELGQALAPERVVNGDFRFGAQSWFLGISGGSTITFGALLCTLTAVAGNKAFLAQNINGLIPGQQYTFTVIQAAPLDPILLGVGTVGGSGFEVAQTTGTLNVLQLTFTATAASHLIVISTDAPDAAVTIARISVQDIVPALAAARSVAAPFTADLLPVLQYEIDPAGTTMFITSGLQPVQKVEYTGSSFVLSAASFTAPPAEWTTNNYPRALTFFQGRLWFGGTAAQPSKFWGSKSGDYLNFTLGTLADDALAYTIAKRGAIAWMSGAKNLLVGTENTEFVISAVGGAQEVVTPTSIVIEPQSAYGSAYIQPMLLGNIVLYFNGDGRKLYAMGYRFEESGWVSTDLSLASEHITIGRVFAVAYTQRPESIVWALLTSGDLIASSYERGNNIIGWHRHPSKLEFVSIASAPFFGSDVLLAAWRITRGSQSFIQCGTLTNIAQSLEFQDAWKSVINNALGKTFAGFQHLRGETVDVTTDGATHPAVTVGNDGVITTERPALQVIAGHHTLARLTTMPFEPGQTPQGTGTAYKRFARAYVQVISSGRPEINGQRPPDRTPSTPMDTREPARTGRFFTVKLGYELQESIDIQEPLPIDLQVAALFGELDVESL